MATLVSDKFKQLRKRKNTHKKGSKLLMNTLKSGNAATFLPLSRNTTWDDGRRPIWDSPSVIDIKPVASHVEAKAPGHQESEIETVEPAP